jgi:predicted aspartyl protease
VTAPFNAQSGLILVDVQLWGPTGAWVALARLALDTGATSTMINTAVLVSIGYDPALSPDRVRMTTASGIEYVPRLPIARIAVLGQERQNFPIITHTLPPTASIDGLLGLDFFRGHRLTLDFRRGRIALT